jgi:hypothetical protein
MTEKQGKLLVEQGELSFSIEVIGDCESDPLNFVDVEVKQMDGSKGRHCMRRSWLEMLQKMQARRVAQKAKRDFYEK